MAYTRFLKILKEESTKKGDKSLLSYKGHDNDVHYIGTSENEDDADLTSISSIKASLRNVLNSISDDAFPNGRPVLPWEESALFSVTTSLTKASIDNPAVKVNGTYRAAIMPTHAASDYTDLTLTVTMGGVDVTSTVANIETQPVTTEFTADVGYIVIPEVTGAIVITAEYNK